MKIIGILQSILYTFMAIAYIVVSCLYIYSDKPFWACCSYIVISTVWGALAGASIVNTSLYEGD